MKDYFVYMVRCKDGTFYVGITNDVDRRVYEHNSGHDPNSYTFTRRPVELAYVEVFSEVEDAIRIEKKIKGWSHAKKLALIEGNWRKIHVLAQRYSRKNRETE